ncbi:hypothetical protein [Aquipseudomonas ullengensis]|uniref:Uncharacterized protein n=1 Tax=Aquipseudomonas ullengensis TaxID=2759166 RepID=A0A7W4LPR1_9GAMM|nr:hypothetical protein [Pseudomonas ullengensis]MBB2497053.1 hypothetical protein [Pseudomonas ullengensis]
MNTNAYSQPITRWKDSGTRDNDAASPYMLGAVEWEASYLLPQWLAGAELPGSPAASTQAQPSRLLRLWYALH